MLTFVSGSLVVNLAEMQKVVALRRIEKSNWLVFFNCSVFGFISVLEKPSTSS